MDDATQLNDFLEVLANYAPTIPEEVVEYYLQQSGFNTSDPRMCVHPLSSLYFCMHEQQIPTQNLPPLLHE